MAKSGNRPFTRPYRYYEILEVSKNATQDEIRRAYRKLAKVWHPDVNKDAQATEKFKKINVAYEVLSDPVRRSSYDNSPAECPVCWTHEVIQTTEIHWRCRHCGCKFDLSRASEIIEQVEKAAIPERLRNMVRIFQTTQCSWCRKFYTQEPFQCPFGRLRSNCISFDRLGREERQQLLRDEKWWWRMADMIQQVQERGIMGKCRDQECGALNPNPQKDVCWHCGKDTLCCPECQKRGQKLILRYNIETERWKCPNTAHGKEYAIRPKRRVVEPTLSQETCPKCGRNLYYDAELLLWRCKYDGSIYTYQELKNQSPYRKERAKETKQARPRYEHPFEEEKQSEFAEAPSRARTAKGKESDRSRSGSPFDPDHVGYYRGERRARRRKSRGLPGWLIAILIITILAMVGTVVWGLWGSEIAGFFSNNSISHTTEVNPIDNTVVSSSAGPSIQDASRILDITASLPSGFVSYYDPTAAGALPENMNGEISGQEYITLNTPMGTTYPWYQIESFLVVTDIDTSQHYTSETFLRAYFNTADPSIFNELRNVDIGGGALATECGHTGDGLEIGCLKYQNTFTVILCWYSHPAESYPSLTNMMIAIRNNLESYY